MTRSEWKSVHETARQELIDAKEAEATKKVADKPAKWPPENHKPNEVKLVNRKYVLSSRIRASNKQSQQFIKDTIKLFSLNKKQECAFRIVANHAVKPTGEHLKMYLGRMAGTGKSQVIKALIYFFAECQDSYR